MTEVPPWGVSDKKKKAYPASKKEIVTICQKQAVAFLNTIGVDFFVRLPKFKDYIDAGFNTDDLTITTILSVAECYALNGPNKGEIHNTIDVSCLLSVVAFRLKKAEEKTAEKARDIIRDLVCFGQCRESPFNSIHPISKCHAPEALDIVGEDDIDGKKMAILKDGMAVEISGSSMGNATIRHELDEPYNLGKFV